MYNTYITFARSGLNISPVRATYSERIAAFPNKSTVQNPPPSTARGRNSELSEYTFREKESHDLFDEKRLKGIEDANRRIGREEGRAEGELNGRKAIAWKLKEMGMPLDKIAEATGLDTDTIGAL